MVGCAMRRPAARIGAPTCQSRRARGTGVYSLAYVAVQVAPDTPEGTYIVNLLVDDGTRRQAVPVTLIVADSCSGY